MAKKYVWQPKNLKVNGVKMKWSPQFSTKWNGRYDRAQRFIDSEVLRRCDPYLPLQTGALRFSGITGTIIGSGRVIWTAPYARTQYYSKRRPGSRTGELRGPYWFPRMKAVHLKSIRAGSKQMMGD